MRHGKSVLVAVIVVHRARGVLQDILRNLLGDDARVGLGKSEVDAQIRDWDASSAASEKLCQPRVTPGRTSEKASKSHLLAEKVG
jgi:hypothetical protein